MYLLIYLFTLQEKFSQLWLYLVGHIAVLFAES
jgi:hypothetical protein